MKITLIKQKALDFMAVNKYHPILLYAAISSIVASIFLFSLAISLLLFKWLWIIGLVFFIIVYLLAAPLEISQADYYMRSYNKKTEETFVFYAGFKREYYKKAVLIRLIRSIVVLLTSPFVFPAAFFAVRTAYVYEILKLNPKLKVIDIFKESNLLVKSSELSFFLMAMSFVGWWALMIVSLGMVSVFCSPYYRTAKSIFFRNEILKKDDNDKNYLVDLKAHLNSILSEEIANMEKKIQLMDSVKKGAADDEEEEVAPSNLQKNKTTFAPITPPFLQVKPISDEKIYMDDIGDIRGILNADSMVDEVEIPPISSPKTSISDEVQGFSQMQTSDMVRSSNESADDFKKRVEKMRLLRDRERAFKTTANSANAPKAPILSLDDSLETEEDDLRSTLEQQEAQRLAQMEEEAFIETTKAKPSRMFDDVFKSEKLDIEYIEEEDESIEEPQKPETVTKTKEPKITETEKANTKTSDTITKLRTIEKEKNSTSTTAAADETKSSTATSITSKSGTVLSQPKRLTREEILEKIRLEREKKGQSK